MVIIGEIRKVDGGYQYFSEGKTYGGVIYKSLSEIQNILSFVSNISSLKQCSGFRLSQKHTGMKIRSFNGDI